MSAVQDHGADSRLEDYARSRVDSFADASAWLGLDAQLTSPEMDFVGLEPPPGQQCAVGSDDGFRKIVVVVSANRWRRNRMMAYYFNRGWEVVSVSSRDGFMVALEEGIWPSMIVTDELEFVSMVRGLETDHVPPIPIYALVEDNAFVDPYMYGATATLPMSLIGHPSSYPQQIGW